MVHVEWNDAPIASYINHYRGRVSPMVVEYTLEIIPNSEAPIKSKMYADDARNTCYKTFFSSISSFGINKLVRLCLLNIFLISPHF